MYVYIVFVVDFVYLFLGPGRGGLVRARPLSAPA